MPSHFKGGMLFYKEDRKISQFSNCQTNTSDAIHAASVKPQKSGHDGRPELTSQFHSGKPSEGNNQETKIYTDEANSILWTNLINKLLKITIPPNDIPHICFPTYFPLWLTTRAFGGGALVKMLTLVGMNCLCLK